MPPSGPTPALSIELEQDGNVLGKVGILNITGTGVTVSTSGRVGTIDIAAGVTQSTPVIPFPFTEVNDPNITLILSGSPNISLLAGVTITASWVGVLNPLRGGTGVTSTSIDWLSQYALLAGRSGGQTLIGGVKTSESLTLKANSVDTTGVVRVSSRQTDLGVLPINIGGSGNGYPELGYNVNFNTSSNTWTYRLGDTAFLLRLGGQNGNAISFYTAPAGPAGTTIFFNEGMRLKDGVGLAIGPFLYTNGFDPVARLHLRRTISGGSAAVLGNARLVILDDGNGSLNNRVEVGFGFKGDSATYQPIVIGSIVTEVGTFTKGSFYVATRTDVTDSAPTERFSVTAQGNVLIGLPTEPSAGDTGIVFKAGTALSSMAVGTAGLYAKLSETTTRMIVIDSAGDNVSLTYADKYCHQMLLGGM